MALTIAVDLSGLKIKDLVLFEQMRTGELAQSRIIELLDRVVVGGASELPLAALPDVIQAVAEAMQAISNPRDGQGKA